MAKIGYQEEEGVKYVSIKCVGGAVPGPVLAQKVGPLGISPKMVGEDLKKCTKEYESLKINARLAVKDRKATVEVTPGTATLIIKALNEPVRDRKKEKNILHSGDISMVKIIEIARKTIFKSHSKTLLGTVKQVVGTAQSVGCTIDGLSPKEIMASLKSGELVVPEE